MAFTLTGMGWLPKLRAVVLPSQQRGIKSKAIEAITVGFFFLLVGLLGVAATYAQTSGAVQVPGRIVSVVPPVNSVASVHLMVQTSDGHGIVRAGTSSEDPADFSGGQSVTLLVTVGEEPVLDDGSGRYTGGLVAIVAGVVALTAGAALWRSRERRAPSRQS